MPDLALIAQAIDFIEDNLKQDITVADMADAVAYSLYHFCRTFNQATHHTPYNYLMRRRLSEAARTLLRTDQKIIDIALDHQVNNPETFSRAFKRVFGLQPSQLRKRGHIDRRRLMPRLTLAHLGHIAKGSYLKPVLVEKETIQVTGVMTLVREERRIISDLWALLTRELKGRMGIVEPRNYFGIACYPQNWEERGYLYLAAAEVEKTDMTSAALVVKTIPALTCARFIHKGPRQDLALTLDYAYHTWLPKSGRSLSLPWVIERYNRDPGRANHKESELKIYIPIE